MNMFWLLELCVFVQKGILYDDLFQMRRSKIQALELYGWLHTRHGQLLHSCLEVHSAAPLGHSAQL
uniref:Secreted protein n=1 Tax=Meloidogyne incognita TaxID=6306 RepID=A0A914MRT1_MELIC